MAFITKNNTRGLQKIATGGMDKRQEKKKPVTRRDWLFPGEKRYII